MISVNFQQLPNFIYRPLRPLTEIDAELAQAEKRIMELLREVTE